METVLRHLTLDELYQGLDHIQQSPRDEGALQAIVIRPEENARCSLESCDLSPEGGVHGDSWAKGCWLSLEDGRPHPDVQVTLINARLLDLVAGDRSRWALAGDQLCVDMDVSIANLPVGQRLTVGSVTLQITDQPHNGCRKFAERYGIDAMKFVNSAEGKPLRLRGVYARVIQAGRVNVGDRIQKA